MRGVAIVFIMLHNLLHLVIPTLENEFVFQIERTRFFMNEVFSGGVDVVQDIFSFLGWYGVAVFLFLSGYGLTLKYDIQSPPPSQPQFLLREFIWKHYKSVFLLMFLPYIPFVILQIYHKTYLQVILQMSLVANIFSPDHINPGVFWFFGLIIQFYVVYALLRCCKNEKVYHLVLFLLNILSLCILFIAKDNSSALNWLRHNFIGWMLPFSVGILFAKCQCLCKLFDSAWKNVGWLIGGGILINLANYNYYAWILSSVIAIFCSIGLTKLLQMCKIVDNGCVWIGALSAFIFPIHPIIRFLCMKLCPSRMVEFSFLVGYVIVSIVVAFIYREIHKRLFSRWLAS